MSENLPARKGEFLLYQTDSGQVKIDVRLEDETIWLTQQMKADLFQTTKQNIGQHLKNVYTEDQPLLRKQVFIKDWETRLDNFLAFNERRALEHPGSVSKDDAETHAKQEYDRFVSRSREHKEQLGEAESIKMLEDAAKRIEETK